MRGLNGVLYRVKKEKNSDRISEAEVCQGIIFPVLSSLGWDIYDTKKVIPEYSCGDGKVDYCLRINDNRIFIEAKRSDSELMRHQKQLLKYAFEEGVSLTVLTNGFLWWFYLPLLKGSWEGRKFLSLDIKKQDIEFAVERFNTFLSYKSVKEGIALQKAKKMYRSKEDERKIETTIPKAWDNLLTDRDELLIELVSEKVESICDLKPDKDKIIDYLRSITKAASEPETDRNFSEEKEINYEKDTERKLFYIKTSKRGGAQARGLPTKDGFKIKKGSSITGEITKSFSKQKIKDKLIEKNILKKKEDRYMFNKDYVFNSSSEAAVIVLGTSASGPREWKLKNGTSLKAVQE